MLYVHARPPSRANAFPSKANGVIARRGGMGQHSDVDTGESEWIDAQVPTLILCFCFNLHACVMFVHTIVLHLHPCDS